MKRNELDSVIESFPKADSRGKNPGIREIAKDSRPRNSILRENQVLVPIPCEIDRRSSYPHWRDCERPLFEFMHVADLIGVHTALAKNTMTDIGK